MNNTQYQRYKGIVRSRFWMDKQIKTLVKHLTKADLEIIANACKIDWNYGIDGIDKRSTGFIEGYLIAKYGGE